MTPVKSAADLAVGDEVEVSEYREYGSHQSKRGTVVGVGKAAAKVRIGDVITAVRYELKKGKRGKWMFLPLRKLSMREIWLEKAPASQRTWGGVPTVIAMATAVRDEIEAVVEDLRIYSAWLQREPKEDP